MADSYRKTGVRSRRAPKRRRDDGASPLKKRLLWVWLPLVLFVLAAVYLSQFRYDARKEAQEGLHRLNYWRMQANVQPLAYSAVLEHVAQGHAGYLSIDAHGHEEHNKHNTYYSGEMPQDRATAGGYQGTVSENLSISNMARSGRNSIDSLMTAIYHRFSLLNPQDDEAGAGWARLKYNGFVVNQGDSRIRRLCEKAGSGGVGAESARYVVTMQCGGKTVKIYTMDQIPEAPHRSVRFPMGNQVEPAYDGTEVPNPVPDLGKTGNPVSIAFYGKDRMINMMAFTLLSPDGEVRDTRILQAGTDPNNLLEITEFALFPIKPLEFDTEYRVEFLYEEKGVVKNEAWSFRTRKRRHWFDR